MGKLVAYSGFSATNYLEMPYNSDLDFGTGDFCVMGWAFLSGTPSGVIIRRRKADNTGARWDLGTLSGVPYFALFDGSNLVTADGSTSFTGWVHVVGVSRGTDVEIYVNSALQESTTRSIVGSVDGATPTVIIGNHQGGTSPFNGSLALLRISATAPTADQIAKIYNDEKVLFQENAQATLYGASDAVTALAHDPDTDLLHVGTSAGRSVFRGLERLSNTTTSVSTAISATGGLVISK